MAVVAVSIHTLPLHSSNWYRVADLRPRLRGHVRIHRHAYRGEVWYVVEDRVAGKYHRFNPASYKVITLLDGRRSLDQVWGRLTAELEENTPSQEEVIGLLGQLHGADLILCDVNPDVAALFQRRSQELKRRFMSRYLNPMSLRFPLFDPDALLHWLTGRLGFMGGWRLVVLWLAVVLPALFQVPMHWPDLTRNFSEQWLGADNLLMLVLVAPLIKICHEFGHGLATRARGGEVHELGVMLLVLMPMPYVDASASSAFVQKTQRMLVGAAGMLTEVFIAALAFYLWILLEPGLARSICYNIIIVAGLTTLLFNGNPLLRYDGYYILCDWLEIPNLASRSTQHWQYLADRYLLKVQEAQAPAASRGEKRWFVAYAPLALIYRLSVMFSIALFVAEQYFFIGVIIALWTLFSSLVLPLYKIVKALFTAPRYADRGRRVRAVVLGTLAVLGLVLFVLPLPRHTEAEAVVWVPEQAIVRADMNGFITSVLHAPGSPVRQGQALVESFDPNLNAEWEQQAAKLEEATARRDAAWLMEHAKAAQLEEEVRAEQIHLDKLSDDMARLTLRAKSDGVLLMDRPLDWPGRFVKRGDIVAYLDGDYTPRLRVVVGQDAVDQVRLATRAVEVKLPQDLSRTWPARILREVPAAGKELPSPALGQGGGGQLALDPHDSQGGKTIDSHFEFELEMDKASPARFLGSRAYVRFEHPAEPVGIRAWHALRRLFLSHFQL